MPNLSRNRANRVQDAPEAKPAPLGEALGTSLPQGKPRGTAVVLPPPGSPVRRPHSNIQIAPESLTHYKANPRDLIDWLVDVTPEESDPEGRNSLILRGIYTTEFGSVALRASFDSPEGQIPRKMRGTSGILLSGDWVCDPASVVAKAIVRGIGLVSQYGDTDYIAVVRGRLEISEVFNDPGEAVVSKAQVVAYIKRG